MHLDKHGLPIQSDSDPLDQLNRVGLLALSDVSWAIRLHDLSVDDGVYVRHVGGNPNNVSGDQLVPVFAANMLTASRSTAKPSLRTWLFDCLCKQLAKRLGFAQNTHDTTPGKTKLMPDFLLHRVLPFIARVYGWHTIVCLADTVLFLNTLVTVIDLRLRNNPDHVDPFVNGCATLYACNVYRPTRLSKLSARMLEAGAIETFEGKVGGSKVNGALRWYHRAASNGNPEIAEVQVAQWVETLKIARS